MAEKSRGWQGAVLKLLRADDYELTVTSRTEITEHYLRIGFTDGGLLAEHPVHPTMWIRMWFPDGDKVHQRGYTLVDIDVDAGTSTSTSRYTTDPLRGGRRRWRPARRSAPP